jgi:Flp pilus assembly protein CpaB
MRNRLLTLVLAVVVGALAVTGVAMYVGGVERRSIQGLKTKSVLVTSRSLPSGMSAEEMIESNALTTQTVPRRYVVPGAITSTEQLSGLLLADDVAAGEQITSQRFRAKTENSFLSQLPKGTEALSLPLEYVRGVAGHIKAGDSVNAYVTAEANNASAAFLAKAGIPSSVGVFDAEKSGATALLLEKLPVREIHSTGGSQGSTAAGDITLAVTAREAALLVHAQERAKLWLTLVPQEVNS